MLMTENRMQDIKNWKGFERKSSWPNEVVFLHLPEGTEKKKENPWVAVAQPQIQV
jgi:hypothetical protein